MKMNLLYRIKLAFRRRRLQRGRSVTQGYRRSDFTLRSPSGQARDKAFGRKLSWLRKLRLKLKLKPKKKQPGPESYGRRQPSKKILARTVYGGLVLGIIAGIFSLVGSGYLVARLQQISFFKVSDVSFSGNSMVGDEKLREMSGIIIHQTSLIGLDKDAIAEHLRRVPWVADVSVHRNFPSSIEIRVSENVPLALVHDGFGEDSELRYIDRRGKCFSSVRPGADLDYPVVTGLYEIESAEVRQHALEEVLIFLNRIQRNDPHLPATSLSEIHLTEHGKMVVYLVEYPFPIFFGNGNTKSKYSRLVEVLKTLYRKRNGKELISEIEYIQMDYMQDKVLVAQSRSS